ncbi:MAG: hypothetical protein WBC60_06745 [Cognaticolwellia sp.]
MKIKIITVFLTITALAGCTSTVDKNQESAASIKSESKTNSAQKLTSKELDELARNTDFTPAELKAAAKKLGYKCSFSASTGSRIKKKVCSTQQQRDVRAEAAKRYMRDLSNSGMTAPKSP